MRRLESLLEKCWIGSVCLVLVAVLCAFFAAWIAGGLNRGIAWLSLAVGVAVAAWAVWKYRLTDSGLATQAKDRDWPWRWLAVGSFVLFALRAFLWLVFEKEGKIYVLSVNNLGDLPLHIQYIRFLAGGAHLWPVNPIHAHSTIGYPIGVDFFNALLTLGGVDLWRGLVGTGLLGCLVTGIALYRWGRSFGLATFLFSGGIAGLAFFYTWKWQDYQQEMDWKSIPLALFVTQRGFLYALPAGLLLLTQWRHTLAQKKLPTQRLPFWLEWLIYSTMPLFHLHTFLFLSAVLGGLAVAGLQKRRAWLLIACSLVPATAFMILLTDFFQAGSQLAWLPGWMQGPYFSLLYWAQNFGTIPVFLGLLLVILLLQWRQPETREAWLFVAPSLLVFAATLFIKFSPWAWDNTKLMMWSLLAIAPFLWERLLAPTPFILRTCSCVFLFFSGFISLWGGLGAHETGYSIAVRSEIEDVGQAVADLPIKAVFACAPEYAHPLVFHGRRLALGYHGHMSGHGLNYAQEKADMDTLMNGLPGWGKAARNLGVTYLFWSEAEKHEWPRSLHPWEKSANLIASGPWGDIYELGF